LISSFLIPFHSYLPACMYVDDSYVVKPKEYRSLGVGLMLGSIVRGMLVVSGGDDYIRFSVEDSSGNNIVAGEAAQDRYFFEFQPSKTDSYTLILDNSGNLTEKSVYWIVWVYYYNVLFLLSSVVLVVTGIFTTLREERMLSKVAETSEEARKAVETSLSRLRKTDY